MSSETSTTPRCPQLTSPVDTSHECSRERVQTGKRSAAGTPDTSKYTNIHIHEWIFFDFQHTSSDPHSVTGALIVWAHGLYVRCKPNALRAKTGAALTC